MGAHSKALAKLQQTHRDTGIDFRNRAVMPMYSKKTGMPEFELIVYGVKPTDLMTIPNEIVAALAGRYPDHQGTMFDIRSKP